MYRFWHAQWDLSTSHLFTRIQMASRIPTSKMTYAQATRSKASSVASSDDSREMQGAMTRNRARNMGVQVAETQSMVRNIIRRIESKSTASKKATHDEGSSSTTGTAGGKIPTPSNKATESGNPSLTLSGGTVSSGSSSPMPKSSPLRKAAPEWTRVCTVMPAMTTNAASVEEQLANITKSLEGVTTLLHNQDRRINDLAEKVESMRNGETSRASGKQPQTQMEEIDGETKICRFILGCNFISHLEGEKRSGMGCMLADAEETRCDSRCDIACLATGTPEQHPPTKRCRAARHCCNPCCQTPQLAVPPRLCYVDAGYHHTTNRASVGAFLLDENGGFLAAFNAKLPDCLSPLMAEAFACKEALSWLRNRGEQTIKLFTDCLPLQHYLSPTTGPVRSYVGYAIDSCNLICLISISVQLVLFLDQITL
ncbi:PREDICTED: uncharacterized protein LOC109173837 isoform X1 [Ipomoea nil]|uniref:uncharacterized protein LOC109173837 isoform X1 n=1 Tax=Ipomoea nil TaxID=35883 RepID=UPI0009010F95|nr:PREDICTED: uncharacterized protein LOC109173837 isoform X1 [Ipomoea nil]